MEADRVVQAVGSADRWPGRVRLLAARWGQPSEAHAREADLAEMWRLLSLVLHRAVRSQAAAHGRIESADVVDIAADKALELLGRLDAGRWTPASDSDPQIAAYLATVARNGVIDFLRRRRREVATAAAFARIPPVASRDAPAGGGLELSVDGGRYARALVDCASRLTARARRAWFLRVFCDFTAVEIAAHPAIRTTAGGADLMLNRCRRQIRKCLQSLGIEPSPIPPGTFVALWERMGHERDRERQA
jgi:DNA-directed RNA polymerase specialized sigma24 family protein